MLKQRCESRVEIAFAAGLQDTPRPVAPARVPILNTNSVPRSRNRRGGEHEEMAFALFVVPPEESNAFRIFAYASEHVTILCLSLVLAL